MDSWLITLIALWTYPIIALIIVRRTKNGPTVRKKIILASLVVSMTALIGLLTHLSTTVSTIDWIFVTSIYFTISLLLWWTTSQTNIIIKVIGIIVMTFVFGLGYISGTVGALGVGFVTAEYSTDKEQWLEDGLIYKETALGNAIADYRGKRVEIYRTISWFPIIEWRIQHKEYYNRITYIQPLTVDYKQDERKICLTASEQSGKDEKLEIWTDTLTIK
jgi:hypothetical protein